MTFPVQDLRKFLMGRWQIARRISDIRQNLIGRLVGSGNFASAPHGLLYDESGLLRIGLYQGRARRRYLFAFDRPDVAHVHHTDGDPFHLLDLSSGRDDIHHQCGEDHYRGRYRVLDGNRFVTSWDVTGPRKRYRATTIFLRPLFQPGGDG